MKKSFLILFIFLSLSGFSQIFEDSEIDESKIIPWITNNIDEYEGVCFFGISEAESTAVLAIADSVIDFQVHNNGDEIYNNGTFVGWERNIINYTNIRITGNKFLSDQTNGEFVYFQNGNEKIKGLLLDKPPIDLYDGKYEIGKISKQDKNAYFPGKYVNTKFEIILLDELRMMMLIDLKIMRNEIFARYGYQFIANGKMEKYFTKFGWYTPEKANVNDRLTKIEKMNIANIRKIENEKSF